MDRLKCWYCAPLLWFAGVAALLAAWAVMDPVALDRAFNRGGYSPFELATLPFFAAIVPLVWWRCPFTGSRLRRIVLCSAVSVVAVMAIVKQTDLHNCTMHAIWPELIGDDGSIIAGTLVKPNGSPLTGTPFKARFITNGAVPLSAKSFVALYFTLFFGLFAALWAYFALPFVKGVFKLDPVAWTVGCMGGAGALVQISDRLPAWCRHAAGIQMKTSEGAVDWAASLCTALEEGGELLLACFALMAIYQSWHLNNRNHG